MDEDDLMDQNARDREEWERQEQAKQLAEAEGS